MKNLVDYKFDVTMIRNCEEIPQLIDSDYLLLPIPTLNKSNLLNLYSSENGIEITELLDKISERTRIISCNYSGTSHIIIDINKREDFAYLNAIPTAEGAIYKAIESSEKSLFDCNILVTGFGRVAKVLCSRLVGFSKNITVAARSLTDLSYSSSLGYKTLNIYDLSDHISKFDLIFQTVPHIILDKNIIDNMNPDTIVIELSSKSCGTDYSYADSKPVKIIHAPALPEKIAPLTAGNILTKSVLSIIAEEESKA